MDEFDSLKLENQLCFAVYTTAHAFTAAYKPLLEPLGLTYSQYLVMIVLWEEESLMVGEIASRLKLDSATLTPVLKRMEKAGLVYRQRDTGDERQVRISLTSKGVALREHALKARQSIVCTLGDSEEQIQSVKLALDEVDRLLRTPV
jgi:DNA-binding MarR family transcriptional regulator